MIKTYNHKDCRFRIEANNNIIFVTNKSCNNQEDEIYPTSTHFNQIFDSLEWDTPKEIEEQIIEALLAA